MCETHDGICEGHMYEGCRDGVRDGHTCEAAVMVCMTDTCVRLSLCPGRARV